MEYIKTYRIGRRLNGEIYEDFKNSIEFIPKVGNIAPIFFGCSLFQERNRWIGEISSQKMISLHGETEELFLSLIRENMQEFIRKVKEKVQRLHDLDIAHGDLHLGNIVLKEDPFNVYFIDWDTAFYISKSKNDQRVKSLMKKFSNFDDYDEFVENDFVNFEVDLEDLKMM